MIKNINTREQVSALVDGELGDASIDASLALLRDSQSQQDWEIYHRIGDVLNSDELANPLSTGFAARMAARLEAEAPHVLTAPQTVPAPSEGEATMAGGILAAIRRHLVPGMAGTAALLLAFMTAPQWMPASSTPIPGATLAVQSPSLEQPAPAMLIPVSASDTVVQGAHVAESQNLVSGDDIVRDPHIDQYLMAHQRFSPSAHSRSQFARSATFATGADN